MLRGAAFGRGCTGDLLRSLPALQFCDFVHAESIQSLFFKLHE